MSEKPVVAAKAPSIVELEPGTYYWCSCGRSASQPFCDGSHSGTTFSPMQFEIIEKKRVALCDCKITCNAPFCDGAHKKLP
ncbi:MAG: CDGSH iron-sulfur domain-containing protein [bacterium]|nr:CDGSH iron-sulfur domain-containing protein [bacterium]